MSKTEPEYWIEADVAVKDHTKVIGYSVWHLSETAGRECVRRFSADRKGGWKVAHYLAIELRDDLNGREG